MSTKTHVGNLPALVRAFLILLSLSVVPNVAASQDEQLVVPENAYANGASYGKGWSCEYGFRDTRYACVKVVVPANGYLNERGDGWKCNRGFRSSGKRCDQIDVPVNGFLSGSTSGTGWKCERGYTVVGDVCIAVNFPANAFLSDLTYGPGWLCERGFTTSNSNTCVKVIVPANAHLVRRGDAWKCNEPYKKLGQKCIR